VLLRTILLLVIAWIVVRMFRTFAKIKQSSRDSGPGEAPEPNAPRPEDIHPGDIKDAEFIDLTTPGEHTNPPKTP
jgi:hypothetical protein